MSTNEKIHLKQVKRRIYLDDLEGPLQSIIDTFVSYLGEALENNAVENTVKIETVCEGYGDVVCNHYLVYERPETDKEREIREKNEAKTNERVKKSREKERLKKEERERKEFERLSKKFGGKVSE